MLRDLRKYLYDISQACARLKRFSQGKTLSDYSGDEMLRAAVERQFEIIGEALNQAVRLEPSVRNTITAAPRIIAFRNQLIHGYADISDDVVWGVLESSLPQLSREVERLLAEHK